jgi:hypothetical protein
METSDLIARLAAQSGPVRRLPAPWVRGLLWLAISAPYVAIVVMLGPMPGNLAPVSRDAQFLVEQAATLATAVTASAAAFFSVIPGYDRRLLLLPLIPFGAWLATLGEGCLRDWIRLGAQGLELRPDWSCLPSAAWIGIVPAVAMVIMLRRGAPLFPRASVALGGLAVAALANFGLRLFHLGDASIMVLFWHFGSVAAVAALVAFFGRKVLYWQHHSSQELGRKT